MALAFKQTGYWQNGVTLFQHALDVTENNYWARYKLGEADYLWGTV